MARVEGDAEASVEQLSPSKRALLELRRSQRRAAPPEAPGGSAIAPHPGDTAPLSYAQQRLWLLDQLHPGLAAYNVGRALRLRGELDAGALEGALGEIVARHAVLRTAFVLEGEAPVQRVLDPSPFELPLSRAAGADEATLRGLIEEEVRRPFDLGAGALLRGRLWEIAEDDRLLVLTTHHIASDEGSREVLFAELSASYDARRRGQPSPLAPLDIQYRDYAAWERRATSDGRLEEDLAWWRTRLKAAPAELDLRHDRPRETVPSYEGARLVETLDEELLHGLRELARARGVTLFMVLLTAVQTLLSRLSGQDDVVVGAPISGRSRPEVENLVGLFANTLALRCDLSGDPSFDELLVRVRETTVGAYEHQEVPFDRLVEDLATNRDLAVHPLFQVLFNFIEQPSEQAPALSGLEVEPVEFDPGVTKFDFALVASVRGNALRLLWEYSTELFEEASIARLCGQLKLLLEGILADPGRPVSRLPLLSEDERHQILEQFNATEAPLAGVCVHELVSRQAAERPQATAVSCAGASLSYGELEQRSNRLAHELRELGVQPGVLVGCYLDRSVELMVGLLGVLKAGGAYVPLDPGYPPERLRFMVTDAEVRVLLTRSALKEDAPGGAASVLCVDEEALGRHPATPPAELASPEDLAYVIYTSGSTGRPKGVMIEHRNLTNLLASMAREPGLTAEDTLLAVTTFSFDIAAFELFGPLTAGGQVAIATDAESSDPDRLLRLLDGDVTVMQATPSTWRMLLMANLTPKPGLRVVCGGEALPRELAGELLALTPAAWNFYGPTETTVWSTCWRVGELDGTVPIGRPIDNTSCYVLDGAGEPVPAGVLGELHIGGAGVARGYLGREELSAEKFVPDPFSEGGRLYRTGDVVRLRPDGLLEFQGRSDHQVKLRGFRIELGEIEAVLAGHPGVSQALAHVREDTPGDQRLVGYVVGEVPAEELTELARRHLPEHMVPGAIVSLEALPLTPNGKIDRASLPAPTLSSRAASTPPSTPLEEHLVELWTEVLGVEGIGIHDSFFALGGHSLLVTRLMARTNASLGTSLPMRSPFEAPTVAQLAELLEASRPGEAIVVPPSGAIAPQPARAEANGAASSTPRSVPASFQQRRLWFLDRLQPGRSLYNIPLCLRISGELDSAALQRALDQVLARHEALRVTFAEEDGTPVQVVGAPQPFALAEVEAGSQEALGLAAEEASRPFDLATGPLARASLIGISPREHILAITLHHTVADGWSLNLLAEELGALYKRGIKLAPPELQYGEYVAAQEALAGDGTLETQLEWWRSQLLGASPELELPTDHPRPVQPTGDGARYADAVEVDLVDGLDRLAAASNATPYMVLLAAFAVLLARCSGQEDIVVGTPISGRSRPELEGVFGYLANTLALRCDLSGDPSFEELLGRVRETALGAYEHQEVPFDRLVEDLAPDRDIARHPLFQVLLALQDDQPPVPALDGADVELLDVDRGDSRFDLSVSISRRDGALRLLWEYSTELFEEASIARLCGQLKLLLEGILADPGRPVSRLPLLSEDERHQILEQFNATEAPLAGVCVHELVSRQAAERPQATAVSCAGASLSYGELEQRSNRLAHELRELGVQPGVLVGCYLDRSVELMVGLLGVLKAGGAYVPLDPGYPPERLRFMVTDAEVRVLLTRSALKEDAPGGAASVLCVDEEALGRHPATPPAELASPEDLAYVIYTSGSTGRPKGVMIEHRNLTNLLASMAREPGLGPGETMLGVTTPAFDLSVPDLYLPLVTGARLLLAKPEDTVDPGALSRLLEEGEATVMQATPSTWRMLLEDGWKPARPMRVVVGGEAVPPALAAQLRDLMEGAWNFYGPTETTVWSTCWRVGELDGTVPIGRPIDNTSCYVLDGAGEPVPAGVLGELHIGGAGVARGYLGREELSAEKFVPDPFSEGGRLYRTGDVVRLRPDGLLEFQGRSDHQVKLRGFRIELGEIEAVLAGHPGVSQALAHVREDTPGDQRLVAYVVGEVPAEELTELARRHLPEHMVPGAIVSLEALPLTPNGKIDRASLPAPTLSSRAASTPPSTPLEEHLVELWTEVLGVEGIGIHDSFFALGGHSLLVTKVIARVRNAFGVDVPLRRLYEAPTIAQLAEIVASALIDSQESGEMEELLAELEELPDEGVSGAL